MTGGRCRMTPPVGSFEYYWDLVTHSLLPILGGAVAGTIPLSLASFALGLLLAILVAMMRISKNSLARGVARTFVSIIRGTPLLVQLFVVFYGLPTLGVLIDPWPSAIIALSLERRRLRLRGGARRHPRRAEGAMGGGLHHRHVQHANPAQDRAAAGRQGLRAAAVQHLHQLGEGHLPRLGDPGHRAVPAGAADRRGEQPVPGALHRGGLRVLGDLLRPLGRGQSAIEKRLDRYVAR